MPFLSTRFESVFTGCQKIIHKSYSLVNKCQGVGKVKIDQVNQVDQVSQVDQDSQVDQVSQVDQYSQVDQTSQVDQCSQID